MARDQLAMLVQAVVKGIAPHLKAIAKALADRKAEVAELRSRVERLEREQEKAQ